MSSLGPISAGVTRYLRRYLQISADICSSTISRHASRYLVMSEISSRLIITYVALPSHAIPSPASAAAQWRWMWWGRCRPWLSLLLTWSKKSHFRRVAPIVSPPRPSIPIIPPPPHAPLPPTFIRRKVRRRGTRWRR